jgi:L-histidine N-alpha-methyltransferase
MAVQRHPPGERRITPSENGSETGTGPLNSRGPVPVSDAPTDMLADVLRGLRATPKELPCRYFYDDEGSRLFERITELPEYYLTRTEHALMERHAKAMASLIGPRCVLIEYGSGSSTKTRLLLDQLTAPLAYVPVDLAATALRRAADQLAAAYPSLRIVPLARDFTKPLMPPAPAQRRVVYFPGSTIGNFTPAETITLLKQTNDLCGPGGGLLFGADLKKDPAVLHAAYNDAAGVTAAFNKNLLARLNRELGADFDLEQFWHHAFYNPEPGRIEMHLVSRCNQRITLAAETFPLADGETIRTEFSYKYAVADIHALATAAGYRVCEMWSDDGRRFGVFYFCRA